MNPILNTDLQSKASYYIPYHCVIKPESLTTPLNVVIDASAKTYKGISLNVTLLTEPKLQKDIFNKQLNLRFFPIVLIYDI